MLGSADLEDEQTYPTLKGSMLCGRMIPETICGVPFEKKGENTMKKLMCLVLCAAMVISLAACGKSESQKEVDLKAVAAEAVEE
jgi:hypothetical protein